VVELVGGAGDVVLESSEVQMDALITRIAVLTAGGLDNDPLEDHRAGLRVAFVLLITGWASSGTVGCYRILL